MPSLKAIIFDLDDTLYPERSFVDSGITAVAHWIGYQLQRDGQEVLRELKQLQADGVHDKLFDAWLAQQGHDPRMVAVMVGVYRDHTPSIQLHPGVRTTLDGLRSRYPLGLLSDGYLETQRNKFRALDLNDCFDAVVFSDELGKSRWKPHPAPYRAVLQGLGATPAEAVYVGDNPAKDFLGARRVGMRSIRVHYPEGVYAGESPATKAHEPDEHLTDLRELPTLLTKFRSRWS